MSENSVNTRKNSTYITLGIAALFLGILLFQQLATFPSAYEDQIKQERELKDLQFKNDPKTSPIPQFARDTFQGLRYFKVDPDLKIAAELQKAENPDTVKLLESTGSFRTMLAYGKILFDIDEKTYGLSAFKILQDAEREMLFIPFTDETTGKITYGGGRYLDIPLEENLEIDFNLAYNPNCTYNADFACPIPPRENHIPIEIRAGELAYK